MLQLVVAWSLSNLWTASSDGAHRRCNSPSPIIAAAWHLTPASIGRSTSQKCNLLSASEVDIRSGESEVPVPFVPFVLLLLFLWMVSRRIECRTHRPEGVNSFRRQWPLVAAPGRSAEQDSFLSFTAQLASDTLYSAKKSIHFCDSSKFKPPLPFASHVPHSDTNNATPRSRALFALSRRNCPCVAA